ncbi:MAG: DUF512 domain-containing protein [Clostridiaceae bacterium]|nr:DUF512 domain-containing protein [Clostridiaceae bacterium]
MKKIKITAIQKGSIAEELNIEVGDILLSINGCDIKDIFDYRFLCADSELTLEIEKSDGEHIIFDIEKDEAEDLGLEFENSLIDEEKSCRNKCIFCFIDQLPKGMRETLYFKDDDARLSFLFGNYITMTNLSEDEIDRIIRYRMSPVNISVHTTNPLLRKKMLNNRFAGDVLEKMKLFTTNGIQVNAQIVLCPKINDGIELDRTIGDLSSLCPQLHSISVVPVGLTKFREGLAEIKPFTKKSASEVIEQIESWQERLIKMHGSRIVYAADEFYIMADKKLPAYEAYEDFPQIENGVGMVRSFLNEAEEALKELPENSTFSDKVFSVATGVSMYNYLRSMADKIERLFKGIKIIVIPVENTFFGTRITVTGLLTGYDLKRELKGKDLGNILLLSKDMFRAGTDYMLDDVTVSELEQFLGINIKIVDNSGQAFIDTLVQS